MLLAFLPELSHPPRASHGLQLPHLSSALGGEVGACTQQGEVPVQQLPRADLFRLHLGL